jgi:hypothetical protein
MFEFSGILRYLMIVGLKRCNGKDDSSPADAITEKQLYLIGFISGSV